MAITNLIFRASESDDLDLIKMQVLTSINVDFKIDISERLINTSAELLNKYTMFNDIYIYLKL